MLKIRVGHEDISRGFVRMEIESNLQSTNYCLGKVTCEGKIVSGDSPSDSESNHGQ